MIDWTDILEVKDHATVLAAMYLEHRSIEELADKLGVSKGALRDKLISEGIQLRAKGGPRPNVPRKSRLDNIPPRVFEHLTVDQIARIFDMDKSAVYKFAKKRNIAVGRKALEADTGESNQVQAAELPSSDNVGDGDVDLRGGPEGEEDNQDITDVVETDR